MTTLPPDIRLLLDLYVDGEIDPADVVRVDKMLQQHAAARQYVANLKLVGELFRMDLAQAQSRADLDGVFERVCARLGYLAPRDAELELWFSGLGAVRLEFRGQIDIRTIGRLIGDHVLN